MLLPNTDLEDIENYISQDSPTIARKFINKIFDNLDQLYDYPESGEPVREIKDISLRELLINKCLVIYRIVNEENITLLELSTAQGYWVLSFS